MDCEIYLRKIEATKVGAPKAAPGRPFLRFVNTPVLYATGGISGLVGALTK